MKKILKSLLTLVFFTIIISACQPQADVSAMLENAETRNQIYEVIISDHEYSKQLMQAMMEDDHTQMMMKGNGDMITMMMSDNEEMMGMMKDNPEMMSNMMNMAESDSSMCSHMMTMMKDKPNMMGQMMEMMHKEGMMDKETMMRNKEKMVKGYQLGHH